MNLELSIKQKIENALMTFDQQPLRQAATSLLNTLGYYSKRVGREDLDNNRFERIKSEAAETTNPDQKLCYQDWQSFAQIMQVADEEVKQQLSPDQTSLFESTDINDELRTSYMFDAMRLKGNKYTRTQLSNITRFVSIRIPQSFMLIFRYGDFLSLAIINRRKNLQDPLKQVLEKVTLIKDINLENPKRAHKDIISELHLQRLIENKGVKNFDTLHDAWEGILNTEPLNRKFYKELYKWFQWAVVECNFPDDDNDMQVIRMVTRLLFIWFLKEKGLVPEDMFEEEGAHQYLKNFDFHTSDYYQAILQNLFFATLNTPIKDRVFSKRDPRTHRDASKYRYADLLEKPDAFLDHLQRVPFVNGGLFDSLDSFDGERAGGKRVECFTDWKKHRQKLHVPAILFFDEEDGIFSLFSRYKFTVEENTPIEQEVALDPELLGQVFENLLGVYNPETRSTARRATGSYYTPRQIVDYMVDEALIAYFLQKVRPYDGDQEYLRERLRLDLLAYELEGNIGEVAAHLIHEDEIASLIQAIDELKIIDPAVGTGAFPMGILNKIVLILRKLDPQNERWKQRQLVQAKKIDDPESRKKAIEAIDEVFSEANRFNNYSRKVYLIQNCIYGVDIQPIAITIAKLRFFISLIIEQETNDNRNTNYGIRPLPNLETKFVAANTLIGLKELRESEFQLFLENEDIQQVRNEIAELREKHFSANTRSAKMVYMKREKGCREQLAEILAEIHKGEYERIQNVIEHLVEQAQLSSEQARQELREELQQEYVVHEEKLAAGLAEANRIADWDAYDQNAVADFFEPEWMFNVKEGFDIAIGNPPYIRHEKIMHLKPALQKYFDHFFTSTADISVYFYKCAAELLCEGGFLTYICTNKFLRSDYGENLRQFLTTEMSPQVLLDLGNVPVFKAAVDTCITLMKRDIPKDNHSLRAATLREASDNFIIGDMFEKQSFPVELANLSSDVWAIAPPNAQTLLKKLRNTGKPFYEVIQGKFYFGIKTGHNEAYIIDANTRESLIDADDGSNELIKPLLRGKNLSRWKADSHNEYLITIASSANRKWAWSNSTNTSDAEIIFKETYPAIFDYLSRFQEKLVERADQGMFYWELRSCSYYSVFEKPKFIYPDISPSMRACYDTDGIFGEATTFCIPSTDFSMLAILNSQLFDWYARYKFQTLKDPWTGGSLRYKITYMKHVPIADRTPEQKAEISELVEQILEDPEGENVRDLERQINNMVYRLYGLSHKEIRLIEQTYRESGMDVESV